jgi:hypothetical protein
MSIWLKLLALMALALSATFPAAAETYHGFVKDKWYVVKGGKEVSPQDFATDPLRYMRSAAAYTALRDHASLVVGRPLDDKAFRELIVSNDVRIVECVGRITTDGITDRGKIGRHERSCYKGERLMEVKVPGGFMKLLSLGCYNPIEGERPVPPPPVNGACGTNASRYAFSTTTWPAGGNFCASGEQSSPSILFPQAGGSTLWSCQGKDGGVTARCEASREAPPPPPVKVEAPVEPECPLVEWREQIPPPPTYINVPPMTVSVCGNYIMMPGGTWQIRDNTIHSSVTMRRVCPPNR